MRKVLMIPMALLATAISIGTSTVDAGGAEVIIERGESGCWVGGGDIPGVPVEFPLANATIVVTPRGFVNVTCTGQLPEGYSLPSTYTSAVKCYGESVTNGRITATVGGRVTVVCPQAT